MSNNDNERNFLFGFGSIMNTSTHGPWLTSQSGGNNEKIALQGCVVVLKKSFGYQRRWNFRSATGFTALGMSSQTNAEDINGVLFQVTSKMIPDFDRREVGYRRAEIALEHVKVVVVPRTSDGESLQDDDASAKHFLPNLTENDHIWVYIPLESQCAEADENHPLLQSYVDTVLQGCLEWGGESMAEDFLRTTGGWSTYFLNDIPSSRRPWLFRQQYDTIDRLLKQYAEKTHYADRRHPEEFASAFLIKRMKGTWNVPQRNQTFTGRNQTLEEIHARLMRQSTVSSSSSGGVSKLEVAGMGGVGKTQTCAEYCYRYFPSHYGLVLWLNAESSESLVGDYRNLLADFADQNDTSHTSASSPHDGSHREAETPAVVAATTPKNSNIQEEVIAEVKTRLFQSQVSWLLVFDNLEDRSLLKKFAPRGCAASRGHVLVTTRSVEMELGSDSETLVLGCFSPAESFELIRRCRDSTNQLQENKLVTKDGTRAIQELCHQLGHLPLALGMAAAYMQRCDVCCEEYLERYNTYSSSAVLSLHGKLRDYSMSSVMASLQLSLDAIASEDKTAYGLLQVLSFLGPDQITKALLRSLFMSAQEEIERTALDAKSLQLHKTTTRTLFCGWIAAMTLGGCFLLWRDSSKVKTTTKLSIMALLSATGVVPAVVGFGVSPEKFKTCQSTAKPTGLHHGGPLAREFEQADLVWNILKSFSILSVKEGKGSMHRLLAQALRVSQDKQASGRNLQICVQALSRLWNFKPEDPETWQSSIHLVEHIKHFVSHYLEWLEQYGSSDKRNHTAILKASKLSRQVAVFSAMALNAFIEAQASLEFSLKILDFGETPQKNNYLILQSRAESLHELGRVFRYQGKFHEAQESLMKALNIRNQLSDSSHVDDNTKGVADTLYELGVLEVKKHELHAAARFLEQSLDLRRNSLAGSRSRHGVDSDCAATLHQLAAVYLGRKPPELDRAEAVLEEALGLSRQIGQRAATYKQLARVSIRKGLLDRAEKYLGQALELYHELYGGERTMHMNVAAVKFQQGALAAQRDQHEQAWKNFSECLRIRRHVYSYARRSENEKNPLHIEISCVLHELGCVAFAQKFHSKSSEIFQAEREILAALFQQQSEETSTSHVERIYQACLTNLTWLWKCSKELGDDEAVSQLSTEKSTLKRQHKDRVRKNKQNSQQKSSNRPSTLKLQQEALNCRYLARQYALANDGAIVDRSNLLQSLDRLETEVDKALASSLKEATKQFHQTILDCLDMPKMEASSVILDACDALRDILREHGSTVHDKMMTSL